MTPLKVVSVDILSDGSSGFFDVIVLCQISFFIFEAAEPTLNHDVICPAAFATLNAFFIWKFSSDLFVHTGIYHSCNNDTLKNAFFSAQKNCLSIPTKKYMRSVLTLDTQNPNILLSASIRSLVLHQRNTGRSIRNNSRDIIFSNENNIPFSISIKYFCQLMGIHTLIWFNPRLPQL